MPIKPEVGRILKNSVGTSDCFDPKNRSAKFQRNRFVKSTHLGNFAAEIGVQHCFLDTGTDYSHPLYEKQYEGQILRDTGSDWLRLVPYWRARCQNAKNKFEKKSLYLISNPKCQNLKKVCTLLATPNGRSLYLIGNPSWNLIAAPPCMNALQTDVASGQVFFGITIPFLKNPNAGIFFNPESA